MSTVPEKRVDKNGHVVTKHINPNKRATKSSTARIPTGAPATKSSEVEMSETLRADLDAALARYGLTDDDVPGLASAWAERFAGTDTRPLSQKMMVEKHLNLPGSYTGGYVSHLSYDVDAGLYLATVEKEEEDYNDPDDFSETYTKVITDPDLNRQLREFDDEEYNRRLRGHEDRARIVQGDMTPWSILADRDELYITLSKLRATEYKKNNLVRTEKGLADTRAMIKEIFDHVERGEEMKHDHQRPKLEGTTGANSWSRDGNAPLDPRDAVKTIIKMREHEAKTERLTAALREAEALPEGALRDFLLAPREPRTYNTTEGTGRNKKTVTKTYVPKSDLVSEHKSAVSGETYLKDNYKSVMTRIKNFEKQWEDKAKEARAEMKEYDKIAEQYHNLGWTGKGKAPALVTS